MTKNTKAQLLIQAAVFLISLSLSAISYFSGGEVSTISFVASLALLVVLGYLIGWNEVFWPKFYSFVAIPEEVFHALHEKNSRKQLIMRILEFAGVSIALLARLRLDVHIIERDTFFLSDLELTVAKYFFTFGFELVVITAGWFIAYATVRIVRNRKAKDPRTVFVESLQYDEVVEVGSRS